MSCFRPGGWSRLSLPITLRCFCGPHTVAWFGMPRLPLNSMSLNSVLWENFTPSKGLHMSPGRTCTFCVSNKRHTQNSDSGYHGTKIWEGGRQIVMIQHHSPTRAMLLGQASFQTAYLWGKKRKLHSTAGKLLKTWTLAHGKQKKREKEELFEVRGQNKF